MSRLIRGEMEYAMADAREQAYLTGTTYVIAYQAIDIGDGDDNPLAWDVFPLPSGGNPKDYQYAAYPRERK